MGDSTGMDPFAILDELDRRECERNVYRLERLGQIGSALSALSLGMLLPAESGRLPGYDPRGDHPRDHFTSERQLTKRQRRRRRGKGQP